jgi:riboflavin kinase/FMN adenylyltransferase
MYCEVYKMQVFHSFEEIKNSPEVVIALGTFDGIHLGHQKVMRTAMDKAAELGGSSMVVTFSAHPFSVLCPSKEPARLATISQKVRYIADLGINGLVLLPMNEALIHLSHQAFCECLMRYLTPKAIVVGENFTYGSRAAGNTKTLVEMFSTHHHIPVFVLPLLGSPGRTNPISSTVIRKLITLGHMETAASLLGRPYELEGLVVKGDQRGRTIGFPTANMYVPEHHAIPPDGVYAVEAEWDGVPHLAMTNVGANPTFERQYRRIETHILDWSGELYGTTMRVRFCKRLRHEIKFDTVEALIRQMDEDRIQTVAYFQR